MRIGRWLLHVCILVFAAAALLAAGCSVAHSGTRVGGSSDQAADSIRDNNPSPSQVRMVDRERGTLAAQGQGSSTYTSLTATGIEKMATGSTPREILYDGKTFVVSSGTDVTAEDVDITRAVDGSIRVKVGRFGTVASTPQEALAAQLGAWCDRLESMDQASLEALKAEVLAWEHAAPHIKNVFVSLIETALAGGL